MYKYRSINFDDNQNTEFSLVCKLPNTTYCDTLDYQYKLGKSLGYPNGIIPNSFTNLQNGDKIKAAINYGYDSYTKKYLHSYGILREDVKTNHKEIEMCKTTYYSLLKLFYSQATYTLFVVIHGGTIFQVEEINPSSALSYIQTSGLYLCESTQNSGHSIASVKMDNNTQKIEGVTANCNVFNAVPRACLRYRNMCLNNNLPTKKQELTLDEVLEQLYDYYAGKKISYPIDLLLNRYKEITGKDYKWA